MGYEEDFVNEKPVTFDIEGRKFEYKPTTAGDESSWLNDIMFVKPGDKTPSINWNEYNKKKIANILSVPYDKEQINKVLDVLKDWKDLSIDKRYELLGKLKPGLFDKIINAIRAIDEPDEKLVKN